jgi:hypothetical protein
VSRTPLELRENSRQPRLSSNFWMDLLMAGWLMYNSFAALDMLPELATV